MSSLDRAVETAQKGDKFLLVDSEHRERNATIVVLDGHRCAVVDYCVIGRLDRMPEPWSEMTWLKR